MNVLHEIPIGDEIGGIVAVTILEHAGEQNVIVPTVRIWRAFVGQYLVDHRGNLRLGIARETTDGKISEYICTAQACVLVVRVPNVL